MNLVDFCGRLEYLADGDSVYFYATSSRYRVFLWTRDSHFATLDHVKFIEKK